MSGLPFWGTSNVEIAFKWWHQHMVSHNHLISLCFTTNMHANMNHNYTPTQQCCSWGGGYIGFTPSVCLSVHPVYYAPKCPQFWMDSLHIRLKWLLAYEGMLHIMAFDLDLNFKVIHPWLCCHSDKVCHISSCLLYSTYSSGWILSMFCTNDL